MARIKIEVEMTNIYEYTAPAYTYGFETRYIYTMTDESGKVYVWKTKKLLVLEVMCKDGWPAYHRINKGDRVVISASVKGESEYKGQPQTELTRVKLEERTFRAKTPEEIQAEKDAEIEARKLEQLNTIGANDIVWRMPYRQYKEHYSDCETVIDSYACENTKKTIAVIIREGRLKASGVRGKHYSGFNFEFEYEGKQTSATFRAVSEETALKQLNRIFKGATNITAGKIYQYF